MSESWAEKIERMMPSSRIPIEVMTGRRCTGPNPLPPPLTPEERTQQLLQSLIHQAYPQRDAHVAGEGYGCSGWTHGGPV